MNIKLLICFFGVLCLSIAQDCPEGCETCERAQYPSTSVHNHYTMNCTQCSPGYEFDIIEDIYDAVEGYPIRTDCIRQRTTIPNCLTQGNGQCLTCEEGYFRADSGNRCAKIYNNTEQPGSCPRECITCYDESQYGGYQLKCITCPNNNCTKSCGSTAHCLACDEYREDCYKCEYPYLLWEKDCVLECPIDAFSTYVQDDVWTCKYLEYDGEDDDEDLDDMQTAIFVLLGLLACTLCCCCGIQGSKSKEIERLKRKLSIANSKVSMQQQQ